MFMQKRTSVGATSVAAFGLAAALAVVLPGTQALGAPPSLLQSFTTPAGTPFCPFAVQINVVGEPQSAREVGRGLVLTGGGARITLTNADTGRSITVTGAGAVRLTTAPDGSVVAENAGGAAILFGQQRFGLPGIAVNIGNLKATVVDDRTTSETLHGRLIDVCSALSA